jgi:hypothetical protein
MVRSLAVGTLALALMVAPPADADVIIAVTHTGQVTFDASCPPPPNPPFDCPLTANGTGVDATGTFGPWAVTAPFILFSANPVGPTMFRNGGTFFYDDQSPANNDFFGTFTGVIDLATFTAVHTYSITGGTGAFAGASGFGTGSVQLNPLDNTYVETARFVIPLPSTLALLAVALVAFAGSAARKRS